MAEIVVLLLLSVFALLYTFCAFPDMTPEPPEPEEPEETEA